MEKKEELLINAANIIYEEGIQKLTMEYLAEKSGITKGGVLYHFKSKSNLIYQMNKMAIDKFEGLLSYYSEKLTGPSIFTRSYAYAILHFLKGDETALLPAVFISSLEDEKSFKLWEVTSAEWDERFADDSGNKTENLKLQLICDGVWFYVLFDPKNSLDEETERMILDYCETLEKERDE